MSKPIVAVVGRPNVGKSTLFNKLCGQRLAIVEDTPGITRDRIFANCEWNGHEFFLVDTGGIEPKATEGILAHMREQAQIAIDTADCIIIVPVKKGLSAFLQVTEQSFFHIVEYVEAHKDIRHVRRDAVGAFGKMLRHVFIQRPFVQHSFFFQPCVERGIDVVHPVPQGEELLFQPTVAFDGKVLEKMFQGLFLAGCQEIAVVQFLDGLYVAEEFMRVGQMLVDVV